MFGRKSLILNIKRLLRKRLRISLQVSNGFWVRRMRRLKSQSKKRTLMRRELKRKKNNQRLSTSLRTSCS
jgi:hypothetical protein